MISHNTQWMHYEGETFDEHPVIRSSLERRAPVMITVWTTILPYLAGPIGGYLGFNVR